MIYTPTKPVEPVNPVAPKPSEVDPNPPAPDLQGPSRSGCGENKKKETHQKEVAQKNKKKLHFLGKFLVDYNIWKTQHVWQ